MKRYIHIFALATGINLFFCSPSFGKNDIIDIGQVIEEQLNLIDGNVSVFSINDLGQVVGSYSDNNERFLFIYDSGVIQKITYPPPPLRPADINNNGYIVGGIVDRETFCFLFDGVSITNLGIRIEPNERLSINDNNQIVGTYPQPNPSGGAYHRAFLYDDNSLNDIWPQNSRHSYATSINNNGHIVGHVQFDYDIDNFHAFLLKDNEFKDLGTLGYQHSYAYKINNHNVVVGEVYTYAPYNQLRRAFIYEDGEMKDLGTLKNGQKSAAYSINDLGVIVGEASTDNMGGGYSAFVYKNRKMYDLNDLVNTPTNSKLWNAVDVNNNCQIIGRGWINGEDRPYMVTLTFPSTPWIPLLLLDD